jgi:imidazolonepropionase-like amidohydrolase
VEESLRRHLAAGCARVDAQQRRLPGRGRATGQQALAAATSLVADACAVGDRKGRLRRGYDADLLAVRGGLAGDVRRLADVTAVFLAGSRVDRTPSRGTPVPRPT